MGSHKCWDILHNFTRNRLSSSVLQYCIRVCTYAYVYIMRVVLSCYNILILSKGKAVRFYDFCVCIDMFADVDIYFLYIIYTVSTYIHKFYYNNGRLASYVQSKRNVEESNTYAYLYRNICKKRNGNFLWYSCPTYFFFFFCGYCVYLL